MWVMCVGGMLVGCGAFICFLSHIPSAPPDHPPTITHSYTHIYTNTRMGGEFAWLQRTLLHQHNTSYFATSPPTSPPLSLSLFPPPLFLSLPGSDTEFFLTAVHSLQQPCNPHILHTPRPLSFLHPSLSSTLFLPTWIKLNSDSVHIHLHHQPSCTFIKNMIVEQEREVVWVR